MLTCLNLDNSGKVFTLNTGASKGVLQSMDLNLISAPILFCITVYLLTVGECQKLDRVENIQLNSWKDVPFRSSTTRRPSPTQEIWELQIAGVALYKGSATTCPVLHCSLEIIWLRSWDKIWVGKERLTVTQDSQAFAMGLFTTSSYCLQEKRMAPHFEHDLWSNGAITWEICSGSFCITGKDTNGGHAKTSKFPFRSPYVISFYNFQYLLQLSNPCNETMYEAAALQIILYNAFWAQCCLQFSLSD